MTGQSRKLVASSVSGFLVFLGYYGSYLPFHKSSMCVSAEGKIATATSVSEVLDILSAPLDQPSPIGQEELVGRLADLVAAVVDKYGERAPIRPLIQLVEHYYGLGPRRGVSVNSVRNLLSMGRANVSAYKLLHEQQYLDAARRYYEMGRAKSPRRPQFIYSLFDVYVMQGNLHGAKEMADLISAFWPQDATGRARVAKDLAGLQQGTGQQGARRDTGEIR